MASTENITKAIQAVFKNVPKLEADLVLKLVAVFTFDGKADDLKSILREIPDEMINHLDSQFNELVSVQDLVTVGKLFRLEANFRSGNLTQDYSLTDGKGGVRVAYKAKSPIMGMDSN